jgi:ankyrin repeat protein
MDWMKLRELCFFNGSSNSSEIPKLLMKVGADGFDEDVSCQTALHIAAEIGHVDLVKLLMERKQKMDVTDDRGCTPLYKARGAESDDAALYMIDYAKENINKIAKNGKTPLQNAAAKGHRKIVEAIFETLNRDTAVLTSKDNRQRTPLHAAARHGQKGVVEYLLQQELSVTVQDSEGKTPLRSCFDGWSEARSIEYEAICVLLLDAVRVTGLDAGFLRVAAATGSLPVVKELMNKGDDPLAQDEHGWTSIQFTQHFRKEEAVMFLSTTRAVTSFRPSELRNTLPKFLQLSDDRLEVTRTTNSMVK